MRRVLMLILLTYPLYADPLYAEGIELPFELHPRYRAIFIRAVVNGRPVTLLVDTGAASTFVAGDLVGVNRSAIARARFRPEGGLDVSGVWKTASLELDPSWREEVKVGAANLATVSARYRRPLDGILGQDVLGRFARVTIDFEAGKLILTR
jgi:hypothetical protein